MGIYNFWPYTNIHEMNLDWLVKTLKRWADESELYFVNNDKKIAEIEGAFADLKEYVLEYFDSLDVKKEVSDKLEEMLENGELDNILGGKIVTWDKNWGSTLSGRAVTRQRINNHEVVSDESSRTRSMQQGVIYSPSNNYKYDDTTKYLYYWQNWSDEQNTELVTLSVNNNTVLSRLEVEGAGHGGELVVRDNKLYCITSNYINDTSVHYLVIFDISNPSSPSLISKELINLQSTHLIGYDENSSSWYGIGHTSDSRKVYSISDNFTNEIYLYDLEINRNIVIQDYQLDSESGIIYSLSTYPNAVQMNDYVTGEAISSMTIPDTISYISTGEVEFIFVKGNNMYFGSQYSVGCRQSAMIDMVTFYVNAEESRLQERHINNITVTSGRGITIDQNANPLNPTVWNTGGDNLVFKYIEDGLNYARDLGNAPITLANDYPFSFHVNTNAIINLNNKKHGAVFIDENINCYIQSMAGDCIGEPMQFERTSGSDTAIVKTYYYVNRGATLTCTNYDQVTLNTNADVMIYVQYGTLKILTDGLLSNLFVANSQLITQGYIGDNFHSYWSKIDVKALVYDKGNTQYIDERSTVRGILISSRTGYRHSLSNMVNKNIPRQFTLNPLSVSAINGRPLSPLFMFGTGVTTHNYQWGYWNSDTEYTNVPYSVTHSTAQDPIGLFTAHWWKLDTTPPSPVNGVLCTATINA